MHRIPIQIRRQRRRRKKKKRKMQIRIRVPCSIVDWIMNSIRIDSFRSVDRWIVWERMGREKRWTVRDDGRGAEGEGNAHQRGIELRIPCEDHRGIRSHGDSSDSFIRGTCESPVFARIHFVYFDSRGPPVSQDAKAAKLFRLFTFDGRWCIKGLNRREPRTMILIPPSLEHRFSFPALWLVCFRFR